MVRKTNKTFVGKMVDIYKGAVTQQNKAVSIIQEVANSEGHGELAEEAKSFIKSIAPKAKDEKQKSGGDALTRNQKILINILNSNPHLENAVLGNARLLIKSFDGK